MAAQTLTFPLKFLKQGHTGTSVLLASQRKFWYNDGELHSVWIPATRTIVNHSGKFFKYGRIVLLEKKKRWSECKKTIEASSTFLPGSRQGQEGYCLVSMVRLAVSLTKTEATLEIFRFHQPSLLLVTLALGDFILPHTLPLCSHSHPTSYSVFSLN